MRRTPRTLVALAAIVLVSTLLELWLRTREPDRAKTTTTVSTRADSIVTSNPSRTRVTTSTDTVIEKVTPNTVAAGADISAGLIIPVAGIKATQLSDTYTQARSNGRVHDAIDIMAPHNSLVVAATAGTIVRLFQSKRGGTTIYELSPDGHTVYYYAHLDRYAEGITQGLRVSQGELLGYVGDTGDAGPGNYHLHFAIWRIQDPKKFWDGENVNPYPILRKAK